MAEITPLTDDDIQAARARGLAAANWFRLPFRRISWRGAAGGFAGSQAGSSLDFHDHRSYLPGDDPRHINWQASARSGTYTMKLFREEVRPVVDLTFDASGSMWFHRAKALRCMELLSMLIAGATRVGAAISLRGVAGAGVWQFEPGDFEGPSWFRRVLALAQEHPQLTPEWHRLPSRPGAIRVIVSDLLFPADPAALLAQVQRQGGVTILLAPYAREEAQPDWDGNYDFIDAETGQTHPLRVGASQLKRYLAAYAAHLENWKQAALKQRIPLARISAEADLTTALNQAAIPAGAMESTRD